MTKPREFYACLYAREFPAQALLRLRPELCSKPCAVMEGEPPLQQVCSLNTNARRLGLMHGMTRIEVDTFPASVVLPRSRNEENATRTALLECVGAFSPRVEDRSEDSVFVCGIDIVGTAGLFGPPEMLARSLLQRVRALGVSARVTVSSNLDASVSLAKGLPYGIPIRVVGAGAEANALAPLPLRVLGLTEKQIETFSLWGISTLGMLAALPENELIARMGQDSKRLQQRARGKLRHLLQPVDASFKLEERMELDSPEEKLDGLLFLASVLLDQLILRAKTRVLALVSVTIALEQEGGASHSRTVRSALPTTDKQLWIKLLHLDLEAHPPQSGTLAVALSAEPGNTSKVQLGLFSPQLPEPGRWDVTQARIEAIVGEGNVGRAILQDTHAQEGFRVKRFVIPSSESGVAIVPRPRAALRRLRPSEPVSVTLEDLRPALFSFRDRRYNVERAYGPFCLSGEWWSRTLWGQEHWDLIARAQDGSLLSCCMVRDLMQDLWQMAALYD
jgi:protein ImuB